MYSDKISSEKKQRQTYKTLSSFATLRFVVAQDGSDNNFSDVDAAANVFDPDDIVRASVTECTKVVEAPELDSTTVWTPGCLFELFAGC
jgi:hypothetical protein